MALYSVYGIALFWFDFVISLSFTVGFFFAALGMISILNLQRVTARRWMIVLLALFLYGFAFSSSMFFAALSAFGYLGAGWAIVFGAFFWILVSPFALCLMDKQSLRMFNSHFSNYIGTLSDDDDEENKGTGGAVNLYSGAEGSKSSASSNGGLRSRSILEIPLVDNRKAGTSSGRYDGPRDEKVELGAFSCVPQSIAHFFLSHIRHKPILHFSFVLLGFVISLLWVFMTYRVCLCNQPKDISTWATRRLETPICLDDIPCHTYVSLGASCSDLTLVSHLVIPEYEVFAIKASATLCLLDATSLLCAQGSTFTVQGSILRHDQISEDRRFLAHLPLVNLQGNRTYSAQVHFTISNGNYATSSEMRFRVTPCLSDLQAKNEPLVFIGGGDYRQEGGIGAKLLRDSIQRHPNAAFVFIGGDIAYANNLRGCYLRWDRTLKDLIDNSKTTHGVLIPFLTAVGNHEGGGYLLAANTLQERQLYYYFYTQYFPHHSVTVPRTNKGYSHLGTSTPITIAPTTAFTTSAANASNITSPPVQPTSLVQGLVSAMVPGEVLDSTLAFHSHNISGLVGFIVLDSDIMMDVSEQTKFFVHAIEEVIPLVSSKRSFLMYHNPIYPSDREESDDITVKMRRHILPLINQYSDYLPIVFENHDHVYKRTKKIYQGTVVADPLSKFGTVYVGDGGLGVWESKRQADTSRWYLEASFDGNYITDVQCFLNGSIYVENYDVSQTMIDKFWV